MSDSNELQALEAINSEVDECLVRITFSNHCIKAQSFLVDRLRKESERLQGLCKNTSSDNLKLEAEIKHAELELESMRSALETLRVANIEIKKEELLAKERRLTTLQRVEDGEKKYEALWNQCKERYESIPFVQQWFAASSQTQELQVRIKQLDQATINLQNEIKAKILKNQDLDRNRIVAMAKYIIEEQPKLIKEIQEKEALSAKIAKELKDKMKEQESSKNNITTVKSPQKQSSIMLVDGDWPSLSEAITNDDKDFMMPRLHFGNDDLNSFRANLDQLKKTSTLPGKVDDAKFLKPAEVAKRPIAGGKNNDLSSLPFKKFDNMGCTEPVLEKGVEKLTIKKTKLHDEEMTKGSFGNIVYNAKDNYEAASAKEEDKEKFKKKKLIHIIEDIVVDVHDAIDMVATVNPSKLQPVDAIKEKDTKEIASFFKQGNKIGQMEDFKIFGSQEVLLPPTPFSDASKKQDPSQNIKDETMPDRRNSQKKRVSFELPIIKEVPEEAHSDAVPADDTLDSQLDNSNGNETFLKMKEAMLKKQKLDLSPDFVYAKNIVRLEDKIVTSKFFNKPNPIAINIAPSQNEETQNIAEIDGHKEENLDKIKQVEEMETDNIEEIIVSSEDAPKQDRAVSGLLFTHGPNGIPESLDVSINTTGFDDGDFPHCIDTSLLLSPKADMAIPGTSDNAVYSQDVPNFLTGLRKTGLSFFGGSSAPEANPEASSSQAGGNFNFNFGGENKKNRGGLFSMFH